MAYTGEDGYVYRLWDPLVRPALDAVNPRTVVEIGSDTGLNTRNLLGFASTQGAVVHVIDPLPKYDVEAWRAEHGERLVFHRSLSLSALGDIDDPDAVLVDGDHNWYTVLNELRIIEERTGRDRFPLVLLHDVCWPYGRRDLYYDPSTIPEVHRQPHRKAGIVPGQHDLVSEGGLNDHLHNAIYENDRRNGVLTAVEDFVAESDLDLTYTIFPSVHGLCLLHERSLPVRYPELGTIINDLQLPQVVRDGIATVERHRVQKEIELLATTRELREARDSHERDVQLLRNREQDLRSELRSTTEACRTWKQRADELATESERRIADAQEQAAQVEREVLRRAAEERQAAAQRTREQERQRQDQIGRLQSALNERDEELDELERAVRAARREFSRLRGRRSVRLVLWLAAFARPLFRLVRRLRRSSTEVGGAGEQGGAARTADAQLRTQVPPPAEADVVVCIHNAPEDVRRCVRSVIEHTNLHRHQLILVDDGSDDPTRELVEDLAAETQATLLRSETGSGYAVAANRGIAATTRPFVVLLNSDTVVGPGWLDHMLECATSMPDVGVVGPLSNAASWQTIPELTAEDGSWKVNELPDGVTVEEVARAISERSSSLYPQVPLVNGFCYLISRRALDEVGPLDDVSFPRGYGEEDDFSLRSMDAGFRHYIADDCYVFHAKSRSYTREGRSEIIETSKSRLRERHGADRIRSLVEQMRTDEDLIRARTLASLVVEDVGRRESPPELGPEGFVVGWLQPHLEQAGGIRRAIEMCNRLVDWGADVHLITPTGERSSWLPIRAGVLSLNDAADEGFDILIGSDPDMVDPFRSLKAGIRVNYHLAPYMLYRPSDERLAEYYRPAEDVVHVANSTWTAEQVSKLVPLEFEGVFPGGIDRKQFRPVRAEKTHDVVCYGSKRPHKGTPAIERAAEGHSLLKMEGRDASQQELAYLISSGRVFVSAAWHEGFNFCPLEAMACGVPVVMTDDGGSRDYAVDGENAIVVEPEDVDALRRGIERVLEDRALRAEMIGNGLRTAWRFDWDTTTRRFAETLRSILGPR